MNTNEKGNVGLIKVIDDLYQKGFTCFLPFDDYNPIDCIAVNANGIPFRLQVKYKTKNKYGSYVIKAYSVVNGTMIKINKKLIDYWAVYMSERNEIVYMRVDAMTKETKHINPDKIGELDEWFKSAPC